MAVIYAIQLVPFILVAIRKESIGARLALFIVNLVLLLVTLVAGVFSVIAVNNKATDFEGQVGNSGDHHLDNPIVKRVLEELEGTVVETTCWFSVSAIYFGVMVFVLWKFYTNLRDRKPMEENPTPAN